MSGGSYDYAYGKIEDLAAEIRPISPLRKAFKRHLKAVAQACYEIEWVDSGDTSPGDEDAAIKKCLGKEGPALVLAEVIKEAQAAKEALEKVLAEAQLVREAQ